MSAIIYDHNYIDRGRVEKAAFILKTLCLDSPPAPAPVVSNELLGPLPLIDSFDDAPLRQITRSNRTAQVIAIDGGSSVLAKGGNVEVIAWRAGMVHFEGTRRISESCPSPQILTYNRPESPLILAEYAAAGPFAAVEGAQPVRLVDELRWLDEWQLLRQAIDHAAPGTVILMDGSLRGNPCFELGPQRQLLRDAQEKAVSVLAVSKQTSLSIGQYGLLAAGHDRFGAAGVGFRQISRPLPDNAGWLGNIFLARLHPAAEKIYRVDINRFDSAMPEEIFSTVSSVCDDVENPGYPYPLTAAHRLARIDGQFRQELLEAIGAALEKVSFPAPLWEYLAGDVHDKLNADLTVQVKAG